jgi:hypothetical protein
LRHAVALVPIKMEAWKVFCLFSLCPVKSQITLLNSSMKRDTSTMFVFAYHTGVGGPNQSTSIPSSFKLKLANLPEHSHRTGSLPPRLLEHTDTLLRDEPHCTFGNNNKALPESQQRPKDDNPLQTANIIGAVVLFPTWSTAQTSHPSSQIWIPGLLADSLILDAGTNVPKCCNIWDDYSCGGCSVRRICPEEHRNMQRS